MHRHSECIVIVIYLELSNVSNKLLYIIHTMEWLIWMKIMLLRLSSPNSLLCKLLFVKNSHEYNLELFTKIQNYNLKYYKHCITPLILKLFSKLFNILVRHIYIKKFHVFGYLWRTVPWKCVGYAIYYCTICFIIYLTLFNINYLIFQNIIIIKNKH